MHFKPKLKQLFVLVSICLSALLLWMRLQPSGCVRGLRPQDSPTYGTQQVFDALILHADYHEIATHSGIEASVLKKIVKTYMHFPVGIARPQVESQLDFLSHPWQEVIVDPGMGNFSVGAPLNEKVWIVAFYNSTEDVPLVQIGLLFGDWAHCIKGQSPDVAAWVVDLWDYDEQCFPKEDYVMKAVSVRELDWDAYVNHKNKFER